MSVAATSKRRPPADQLSRLLSQNSKDEAPVERRDWTRPTMATAVSLLAHALLLGFLAFIYVSKRSTDYAEVVPIEVSLTAPLNLFDVESNDAEPIVPLTTMQVDKSDQSDAPAKLETQSADRPDFNDMKVGSQQFNPNAERDGGKIGDGLNGAGGDAGAGRIPLPGNLVGVGRRVVFVVDRSASMNKPLPPQSPAIEWAKDELIRSIKALQQGMSFQIIFYSDTVVTLPNPDRRKDLIPATEFSKEKAIKFVRDLEAEGGTNHMLGLDRAFELKPDLIFMMTDADDDTDDDLRRLINRVTTLNHRKAEQQAPASIHLLHLWHNEDSPTGVIRELAQRNNGSYKLIHVSKLEKRTDR